MFFFFKDGSGLLGSVVLAGGIAVDVVVVVWVGRLGSGGNPGSV